MDVVTSDSVTLNTIYTKIQANLKNSSPLWDDFISKSAKLHNAIKNVLLSSSMFWESFQKIADSATESQGATKEIGTSFTRLCMRQRLIESKLKTLNQHLMTTLSNPVQEKLEEWRRCANQIDKDKIKGTKKAKAEWKKASGESVKLQKKAVKRGSMRGLGSLQNEVEGALKAQAEKFASLQYVESLSVRKVMTHERQRFCFLFDCMKPILDCEISLLEDITSLDNLVQCLNGITSAPDILPIESEQIIQQIMDPDFRLANHNANSVSTHFSSSGIGSRKSSVASSLNSCDGNGGQSSGSSGPPSMIHSGLGRYNSISPYRSRASLCSTKSPPLPNRHDSLSRIDIFYKNLFENQRATGDTHEIVSQNSGGCGGLRTSHISMSSSVQEASGYSGDYRVSDDDIRQKHNNTSTNTVESSSTDVGCSGVVLRAKKNSYHNAAADDDEEDDDEEEEEDEDGDEDEEEEDEDDEEAKTPSSPTVSLWSEKLTMHADTGQKFRHTISGSRDHSRPAVSPGMFDPPTGNPPISQQQQQSSLTKLDHSRQLYPNQAIPLPVYTNLKELTNAAQRKYSMNMNKVSNINDQRLDINTGNMAQGGVPSLSPSGSKTPGLRRMTLPEVNKYNFSESNSNRESIFDEYPETDMDDVTPTGSPRHSYVIESCIDDEDTYCSVSNHLYAKFPFVSSTETFYPYHNCNQIITPTNTEEPGYSKSSATNTNETSGSNQHHPQHHMHQQQQQQHHIDTHNNFSQTSTLTRQQSDTNHYSTPNNIIASTPQTHHRSASITNYRSPYDLANTNNQQPLYSTPLRQNLMSELEIQLNSQKLHQNQKHLHQQQQTEKHNFSTSESHFDLDPIDLPMPPPPSTAEEEIRLATTLPLQFQPF